MDRELWNDAMKNRIVAANGSIQGIAEIPDDLKELYRTVWELPQKDLVDMAADRGAFIDQSQSFNVFMATPTKVSAFCLEKLAFLSFALNRRK
jgi:ribonucleotide reductase alpha subunit